MKEIFIRIDDDLYHRASQKVLNLEREVNQRVNEYLQSINGDADETVAAKARMAELFSQTVNFSVGVRPTREQMHER
jgi:hypothetical protein